MWRGVLHSSFFKDMFLMLLCVTSLLVCWVQTVCDIMLASVRERKADMPFCFEIAFANVESTVVQAEGQRDYLCWIADLRSTIEKRLFSGDAVSFVSTQSAKQKAKIDSKTRRSFGGRTSPGPDTTPLTVPPPTAAVNAHQARRLRHAPAISEILASNSRCAECDRDSPEWVSLNLGCVVCIDCSGVHRSMGVHISKMRSLNLDDLEEEDYALVHAIGKRDDETNLDICACYPSNNI